MEMQLLPNQPLHMLKICPENLFGCKHVERYGVYRHK